MASEKNNENDVYEHCDVVWVEGFPFPIFGPTEKIAREVIDMKPRPGDIFLATYPKCGTTWTQYIIWGILNDGAVPPNASVMMFKEFPFLELTGVKKIQDRPSPRAMKVHLPYRLTPKSPDAKYVTVMRNAFDCCVSYYHHVLELEAKSVGKSIYRFETYFEDYIKGVIPFGDYFDTVQSWYERRDDANVLFLTYEDMKGDPKGHVLKIAEFLGIRYKDKLENDPQMLEIITKHSSFEYMKENAPFRLSKEIMNTDNSLSEDDYEMIQKSMSNPEVLKDDNLFRSAEFYRKGKVGNAKVELSPEHWAILDKMIDDKIKYPELKVLMRRTKI